MYEDLKFDLCCGARMLYRAGLSAGIAGHLSIKVDNNTMIANRFGPSFGTVTPTDVLMLDLDGNTLDGHGVVNDTIRLHGVIHKVNPSVIAVAHTHPPAVVTFSTLRVVPEVYDQESCLLAGEVTLVDEEYEGLASEEDRVRPVADALGKYSAVIMPNHGAITRGENIQLAVFHMLALEGMVQRNLSVVGAGRVMGITPRAISPEVAQSTKAEMNQIIKGLGAIKLVWQDALTKLRQTDPDLFAGRDQSASAAS